MGIVRNSEFPLDPTFQINGDGSISVDAMLKEPTRITRYVTEKINQDLLSNKIYSSGPVSGGIIMYNQITGKVNLGETALRTAKVAPGGEFPEIDQTQVSEQFTRVQKIGGKITITDEARKRNDDRFLNQELFRLANRMTSDLDSDAVAAFDAAMAAPSVDNQEVTSNGWVKVNNTKAADKVPALSVEADLEALRLKTDLIDLGYNYTTLLLHPEDASALRLAVGIGNEQAFLSQWGYTIEVSKHVPRGEGWLLAPKQFGYMGVETPVSTETWRDEAHQVTHSQTWATMGYAITDPYALVKITGLDAEA